MIDTIDTIDTAKFKSASAVVSMVTLGIDTIDTGDRHHGRPAGLTSAVTTLEPPASRPAGDNHDLLHGVSGALGILGLPVAAMLIGVGVEPSVSSLHDSAVTAR